jgi:DNA (cytosine-5)-methyltransferase 1
MIQFRTATFCSGIAAPECAWTALGWQSVWFSEIDPFASAVLGARFPAVRNLGDMTKLNGDDLEPVDLVCAGTPCQSFSVAGLRKGMADPRGNLALVFLRLVDRIRPRWLVWENVPGVLSSNEGRDFGAFLGALGQLGYGWAYRVLDAQYVGVPQRRRRVFVVGHFGDWRRAAAVLFERHCLSGDSPPSREAAARVARSLKGGTRGGGGQCSSDGQETLIAAPHSETCPAIKARDYKGPSSDGDGDGAILVPMVSHSLRADGFDASEDGTGRGTPLVVCQNGSDVQVSDRPGTIGASQARQTSGDVLLIPIDMRQASRGATMTNNRGDDVAGGGAPGTGIGEAGDPSPSLGHTHTPAIAIQERAVSENPSNGPQGKGWQENVAYTLESRHHAQAVGTAMAVRRLTPLECERLQGFPDNWTAITYRGKPAADGPRYRAIGNSMAVPVLLWIGGRIEAVEKIGGAA